MESLGRKWLKVYTNSFFLGKLEMVQPYPFLLVFLTASWQVIIFHNPSASAAAAAYYTDAFEISNGWKNLAVTDKISQHFWYKILSESL